jgi:hypothetical protein
MTEETRLKWLDRAIDLIDGSAVGIPPEKARVEEEKFLTSSVDSRVLKLGGLPLR